MPLNSPAYCKYCSLVVAKDDPERIQKDLFVYHGKCWKLQRSKEQYAENCRVKLHA